MVKEFCRVFSMRKEGKLPQVDKIHESIQELEASLRMAFDERVGLIERKLASVTQENTTLHHERVILAKEIQKLRAERKAILEMLGVKQI